MNTNHKATSWQIGGGLVLILIGALFLLGNMLGVQAIKYAAPLMVVAFGGIFFVGMFVGGRQTGALAIPGSMFVILGMLLLAQSILDAGESLSYAWALFAPGGVGVGLVVFSWWSAKPELKRPGYILITIGLALFIVFGILFETLFGLFGSGVSGTVVLSFGLIGLGVLLLLGRLVQWNGLIEWLPPHNEVRRQDEVKTLVGEEV